MQVAGCVVVIKVKYPIIQAGMGPFCNNNLSIAAANADAIGLLSVDQVLT